MKRLSRKIAYDFISVSFISFIFTIAFSCSKSVSTREIMAKAGDRIITVEEFKARIELTKHPEHEEMDESAAKRMLLKNLIAEKCAAMEEGGESPFLKNRSFQDQMRGIREQTMREELYKRDAWDKVRIKEEEISKIYPLAGRAYKLAIYSIQGPQKANILKRDLYTIDPKDREKYLDLFIGDKEILTREIAFQELENPILHDALYSGPLDIGEIIGPLQVEENRFLVMKVLDLTDQAATGTEAISARRKEAGEILHRKAAEKIWAEYKLKMMQDKELFFEREPFVMLSDYILRELGSSGHAADSISDDVDGKIFSEAFLQTAFFSIGDRVWTVGDFQEMLRVHPLVYRKKQFESRDEFLTQFKYAIADLIADVHLTRQAYDAGLDKSEAVVNKELMWRDAMLSAYHMNQTVRSFADRKDYDPAKIRGKDGYIEQYVDETLDKYRSMISINRNALDSFHLAQSGRIALQENAPYPMPVPNFPNYTASSDLIYSQTMESR